MKKTLNIVIVFIFLGISAFSQSKVIRGTVIDPVGNAPLEGVVVLNKNTKVGVATTASGKYSIPASKGDIIQFSLISYKTVNITIGSTSQYDIRLESIMNQLGEVIALGNRGSRRTKVESPVPVDVLSINAVGQSTAKPDLMSQLNQAVPSFNYNKQSGADGSDANDFASLRGLGFDQTLVLINGKRRHLSAFINQTGTRGRGNSGTDLNAIPEASIDRIEILRDGASAQYGSDAIAGVINIILKKNIHQLQVNIGASGFYDHKYNALNGFDKTQYYTGTQIDGLTLSLGLNYGLPIGKRGGFINLGANYINEGKTFRAQPDTNQSNNPMALPINSNRRAFGDGSIMGAGFTLNSEIPIGPKITFYYFGGYNYKLSNVYAYTRNFPSNIQKFPTDLTGNLINVSSIIRKAKDGSIYYNPQEDVRIQDASLAAGLKGKLANNWDWDISNVLGSNDFHYYGVQTFNASLATPSLQAGKNNFDDGGFGFTQNTVNGDLNKYFEKVANGLTLSLGAEYRYESYKLYAGEVDSYANGGGYFIQGGMNNSKNSGSQGYPGYQPIDQVRTHRSNFGFYGEAALDLTNQWLIDAAFRLENYSDFGFVNTYKLASRYKITSNFNLRGSFSTGYRAPSLQQLNFSNTNTNVVNGQLVYQKLVPNYSSIARIAGIPALKQEEATNGSVGFSWNPTSNFTVTLDGYLIKIKNRVVATGTFDSNTVALKPYLVQFNVSAVNFFANAVNTTNTGIDLVLDYSTKWTNQHFKALFAGNLSNITIDQINVPSPLNTSYANQQAFYSTREQFFLKASAPKGKASFHLEYGINKFSVGTHLTYFGKLTTQGFGYSSLPGAPAGGPGGTGISDNGTGWDPYVTTNDGKSVVPENFIFHGKITTDIYFNYLFSKHISAFLGVDNVLNVHPDQSVVSNSRNASAYDSESGGPFDSVQMGFNGLRLFSKCVLNF